MTCFQFKLNLVQQFVHRRRMWLLWFVGNGKLIDSYKVVCVWIRTSGNISKVKALELITGDTRLGSTFNKPLNSDPGLISIIYKIMVT